MTVIPVGAGDALSVVEGFTNIFKRNEKACKPAPAFNRGRSTGHDIIVGWGRVYEIIGFRQRLFVKPAPTKHC